jgi:23S rRNA (cytosine1962-C5)-methyltransferase
MEQEMFENVLRKAAADANVELRQVEVRQQAPDHPALWNVPETFYLKFYIFQVV